MKRSQLVSQGLLSRRMQESQAAWTRNDFTAAIEILESAHRLAPSNPELLVALGRTNGWRYNYEAAGQWFEKVLRFAPRKTEMLMTISEHCKHLRNLDLAERYLQQALKQPDAAPLACVKLAELYERLRRLPEAAQLVERALTMDPACPAARLVRARLTRLAGQVETAEQELRALLAKPVPDLWTRAQSWYELGAILDLQGNYDDAMTAFLEAKSLLCPKPDPHPALVEAVSVSLKTIESQISAEMLRRWSENGPRSSPSRRLALLCGHPRSGTTLLEQVLDGHPDIVSVEESNVFLDDALGLLKRTLPPDAPVLSILKAATAPSLEAAHAGYFRFMELAHGSPIAGRLLIDKNPGLTSHLAAYVRVLPEAKLLVALRDPRDVVISCFMQPHREKTAAEASLSLAVTVEHYAGMMGHWRALAPLMPVPWLEVRYEDMVADLQPVARKALDFLGVPWDDRVLAFYETARKKIVRSPTYADVTQPVYQRACGRWRHYQKYLEPHLARLEPLAKAFGYE
ncbi:MAG TPA: sulfotransferase [Candidatus Acidoferrales bacterium]|nr:sulfotransferase [Candidatus Acidoferrales bacterium]